MFFFGVDPSTTRMGYGIVRGTPGSPLVHVKSGALRSRDSLPALDRVDDIARQLEQLVQEVDRSELVFCAIEGGFVKGQMSALQTGGARMVASLIMRRHFGVEIREYQPASVKLAVTGDGAASKPDVARAVARRLGIPVPGGDAGDALAVALTRAADAPFIFE